MSYQVDARHLGPGIKASHIHWKVTYKEDKTAADYITLEGMGKTNDMHRFVFPTRTAFNEFKDTEEYKNIWGEAIPIGE